MGSTEMLWDCIIAPILCLIMIMIIGWFFGMIIMEWLAPFTSDSTWHVQAIEQGCAQHNPITGDFEWKPH